MSNKVVLWIDDEANLFTGLEAYLLEAIAKLDGYELIVESSYERAEQTLRTNHVELLLFDFILMSDARHASLHRRLGMELVKLALTRHVRRFIAYSVLSRAEVYKSFGGLVKTIGVPEAEIQFRHYGKGTSAVRAVVSAVENFLTKQEKG